MKKRSYEDKYGSKYGSIYAIKNKVNNKLYIGQTTLSFSGRYSNNILNTHNKHLKHAIKKYGLDCFDIDCCFDIAYSKDELDKLEDMYIKIYNTINPNFGYNKKYGGSFGKHSEETKMRIGLLSKGRIKTDEELLKISKSLLGRKATLEARVNIGKAKLGTLNPNSKSVISLEDGKIYDTMAEASLYHSTKKTSVSNCCIKNSYNIKNKNYSKLNTSVGLTWIYLEQYLCEKEFVHELMKKNGVIALIDKENN